MVTFSAPIPPPPPTVTEIESVAERLPESVTAAVIVWVPSLKAALMLAPVPRAPSMLETQKMSALRLPSS
jgi:hypothetical protein